MISSHSDPQLPFFPEAYFASSKKMHRWTWLSKQQEARRACGEQLDDTSWGEVIPFNEKVIAGEWMAIAQNLAIDGNNW